MTFVEKDGLRFYQFKSFDDLPVFHAILTRKGGVSMPPFNSLNFGGTVGDDPQAVKKNHQKAYATLGFDYDSRFDVWQIHGTNIICSDQPRDPDIPHQKADGILTNNPRVTLFMRFADCVPILLADPVKKVIGIIHAGWQGTAMKIGQKAIEKMQVCFESSPGDIIAGVGPSICQSCYAVGDEVYQAFHQQFGLQAETFFTKNGDGLHLDLWTANRSTLELAGVNKIEVSEICTACHTEDWFSHRAEAGKTGRFGVLMSLEA